MAHIHPTAIVEDGAQLHETVKVGPYAVIGPNVKIGAYTEVLHHANIQGNTTIGEYNKIYPFASVGTEPQDLKYNGEDTKLHIGDRNTIREFATINLGTVGGGGITRVGNNNFILSYTHIAHDCELGDHIVLVNGQQLAGHVKVEDYVVIGGSGLIVQFLHIGKHAYLASPAIIRQNVPPFFSGKGVDNFVIQGVNTVGLSRRGFSKEEIRALKEAYKLIYKTDLIINRVLEELIALANNYNSRAKDNLLYLVDFIEKNQEKGISR